MKKNYLVILLLLLLPFKVFASGGFSVSSSSISMYPGESKTISITSNNAVGRLNLSSSNNSVASVNTGSLFIQTPGASESITITGNSVGTTTVSVVASDNFATMDEEILAGQTKNITVNVINKPAPQPQPQPQPSDGGNTGGNTNTNNNVVNDNTPSKSNNNKLKELKIEGFDLVKTDDNNYTLEVKNNVTSINVSASSEDSKAKVEGTGKHELNVGENKIEITVTAEDGSQNKIIINVNRKDGYYLKDIEEAIKDPSANTIVILNKDDIITAEIVNKVKTSKKEMLFNYYDDNKKLIYSWILNGKKINESIDINPNITFDSENKEEILKNVNYSDGLIVNFKHDGKLPNGTNIKLYVGNKYKDKDLVNVYYYNKNNQMTEKIINNIEVKDGYIEFNIEHASEYYVTLANLNNNNIINTNDNNNLIIIIISILLVISIGYIIYDKFINKNKKNTEELKTESINYSINNNENEFNNNKIESDNSNNYNNENTDININVNDNSNKEEINNNL